MDMGWHNRLDQLPQTLVSPTRLEGRRFAQEGKRADIQQGSEATLSSTGSRIYGRNQTMPAQKSPCIPGWVHIWANYPYNATFLALCLSALTMCAICLVIAPLGPSHDGEALFNRIRMQGQHDFESPAELRHR